MMGKLYTYDGEDTSTFTEVLEFFDNLVQVHDGFSLIYSPKDKTITLTDGDLSYVFNEL